MHINSPVLDHDLVQDHAHELLSWTVQRPCALGAGEDISLDVELNKRGLNVVTLDPTPRAKKHVLEVLEGASSGRTVSVSGSETEGYDLKRFDPKRFMFADLGVWKEEKTMRFYSPKDRSHVSHSIVNLKKTEDYFEACCLTLEARERVQIIEARECSTGEDGYRGAQSMKL